jgi:cell wall-associated NlpC family hydrolase
MDRRLTPANGRVAAARLIGQVVADRFTEGEARTVALPVADLLAAPGGARDRQLVFGEGVIVYDTDDSWAFVEARRDGYVGYLAAHALRDHVQATHAVSAPASHLYPTPNLKRTEAMRLSFGARLRIVSASGEFFETDQGLFVPKPHIRPANRPFADPATAAQLLFGVPYLWGGNSVWGIDCSGLVQAALIAAGFPCPGDSDLQAAGAGQPLDPRATMARGDLVFWPGHVAMAVDGDTLIHANAHHMSVAYEPLAAAVARIGAPTLRRRPGQIPG